MNLSNDVIASLLQGEVQKYENYIRASQFQMFGFGLGAVSLLTATVTLAVVHGAAEVGLALPPLGMLFWIMGLRVGAELLSSSAHKAFLERELATYLPPGSLVPWDDAGGAVVQSSFARVSVFSAFAVLTGGVSIASFWEGYEVHPEWLFVGSLILTGSLFAPGLICLREAIRARGKTEQKLLEHSFEDRRASTRAQRPPLPAWGWLVILAFAIRSRSSKLEG